MQKTLSIFLISLLILSAFVLAAGSSTRSNDSENNKTIRNQSQIQDKNRTINCEEPETPRERIKCRLKERIENEGTPEVCRKLNLTEGDKCKKFYNNVRACYAKDGREKDACFRRISGFTQAALNKQGRGTEEIRNYLVALFYDLQERIEKLNEEGKITEEAAANLITQIVDIKTAILSNESTRAEIKTMVRQFKADWKTIVRGQEPKEDKENDENQNETEQNESEETE